MLTTGKVILDVANEHSFAVPAFNISDYAMFLGIIDISEEKNAPVILGIHPDEVQRGSATSSPILRANRNPLGSWGEL